MYKVSIIVPAYNSYETIENAFDSIYNQSIGFDNVEVIFVDDASTDNTSDIIRKYADRYENVKAIFLDENTGYAGKPRNVGIKNASADYLMFLDADDVYLENACELLYDSIHENGLDVVSGNYIRTVANLTHGKSWESLDLIDGEIQVESIDEQPEFFNVSQSVWCKIFRKQFIVENDITFLEGLPAQDVYFTYKSLLMAKGIKYMDIPVVNYFPGDHITSDSTTSRRDKKSLMRYLDTYFRILELFEDHEEYERYISPHLKFFTTQLIVSEIPDDDKVDLLMMAYPLYGIVEKHEMPVKRVFRQFYKNVQERKFATAIRLIPLILPSLTEYEYHLLDDLKAKDHIIVFKSDERLLKLHEELDESDENVGLIYIDDVFDYYSMKFSDTLSRKESDSYFTGDGFKFLTLGDKITLSNPSDGYSIEFESLDGFHEYFICELCLAKAEKPFLIIDPDVNAEIDPSIAYVCDNELLDDWNAHFMDLYRKDLKSYYNTLLDNEKLSRKNERLTKKTEKLNRKIERRERKIENQNSKYDKLLARKRQLEGINDDLREKLTDVRAERDHYKQLNHDLMNSRSWKMTAPLRKIKKS